MTARRRDANGNPDNEPPFNRWVRSHPRLDSIGTALSVTDSDLWIHQYKDRPDRCGTRRLNNIMLIESKTFSADLRYPQHETLAIVGQLLKKACARGRYQRIKTPKSEIREVRFFGVHLVQFDRTSPEDSDLILWDRKKIDTETLIKLLRFELDPDKLRPRSERRHHVPTNRALPLPL